MGTEVISNNEEIVVKPENTEKPTELEEKIIRQIEYYFGDYNLRKDRFLKGEIENDNGWVPLETLIKFNRLKQLSEDFSVISEALKKSPNQLMEVNEDCTKVRRIVPLSDTKQDDRDERTLYVKGFKKDMKLDELLDFFQEYKTENITMRKRKQGNKFLFKGSVFAAFKTKEDCENFFEKEVKFNKVNLHKERKKDYIKRKDEFYNKLREERKQKDEEKSANIKKEIENMKANSQGFQEGCLLRITGLNKDSKRGDIKAMFEKYGNVAYVDHFEGSEKGIIRFDKGVASDVLKDAVEEDGEKKLQIGDAKITVSLIDGEEQQQYFENILKFRANSRLKGNTKYGNKGRFNKKNRGKRQKDNKEDGDEQPNAKRRKADLTENTDEISKKSSDNNMCDPSKTELSEQKNSDLLKKDSEYVEKQTTEVPVDMEAE